LESDADVAYAYAAGRYEERFDKMTTYSNTSASIRVAYIVLTR